MAKGCPFGMKPNVKPEFVPCWQGNCALWNAGEEKCYLNPVGLRHVFEPSGNDSLAPPAVLEIDYGRLPQPILEIDYDRLPQPTVEIDYDRLPQPVLEIDYDRLPQPVLELDYQRLADVMPEAPTVVAPEMNYQAIAEILKSERLLVRFEKWLKALFS